METRYQLQIFYSYATNCTAIRPVFFFFFVDVCIICVFLNFSTHISAKYCYLKRKQTNHRAFKVYSTLNEIRLQIFEFSTWITHFITKLIPNCRSSSVMRFRIIYKCIISIVTFVFDPVRKLMMTPVSFYTRLEFY